MEGPTLDVHDANANLGKQSLWLDAALISLLLLLVVLLRGWLLFHTEVPARDTIGFIRYALAFEAEPWAKVVRDNHQHPVYPLSILAISFPVRAFSSMPMADAMAFSAQLASGLATVLLVIPMYCLGKLLLGRIVGFGAALLFQFLPVPAQILSDGLSEPIFLLLACTALVLAVASMDGNNVRLFVLTGVFGGLAYLTRPEGALIPFAALVVLCCSQFVKSHRRSLRQLMTCGGGLTLAACCVGSIYVLATNGISNKPSIQQMLEKGSATLNAVAPVSAGALSSPRAGGPLLACTLGITFNLRDGAHQRAYKAVWGMAGELAKCFHYFACVPLLLGLWWFRRRPWFVPGMWVLWVLCGLFAIAVWRLAVSVGYFSDRHLLLLVMCGCYPAAAACWEIANRCSEAGLGFISGSNKALATFCLIVCALLAPGLPKALESLHHNRAGYHAAGLWLAENADSNAAIEDDHCWAHYYAGRVFHERHVKRRPPEDGPTRYVVVGRRDREINLTWNRPGPPNEERLRAEGGQIVYHWPVHTSPTAAPIVVYAVDSRPR